MQPKLRYVSTVFKGNHRRKKSLLGKFPKDFGPLLFLFLLSIVVVLYSPIVLYYAYTGRAPQARSVKTSFFKNSIPVGKPNIRNDKVSFTNSLTDNTPIQRKSINAKHDPTVPGESSNKQHHNDKLFLGFNQIQQETEHLVSIGQVEQLKKSSEINWFYNLSNFQQNNAFRLAADQSEVVPAPRTASSPTSTVTTAPSLAPGHRITSGTRRYHLILDNTRKQKQLWRDDPECRSASVMFSRGLDRCALASYPGSGNTWLRYLLEASSGVFTGSVFSDQQIFTRGHYGELDSWTAGTTLLQKTHHYGADHIQDFQGRGVLLIRNPYRAILAYHNYLFGGHKSYAQMSNYRRNDWESFVHVQAKAWLETAVNWIKLSTSLIVVHYEEVQDDPLPVLKHILKFRGVPENPQRLMCLQKHMEGQFYRKQEFLPETLSVFTNKTKDKVDRAVRYVDYMLEKNGYRRVPFHLYEFYNQTADQFLRVPCARDETEVQCDIRVDNLNLRRRFNSSRQGTAMGLPLDMGPLIEPMNHLDRQQNMTSDVVSVHHSGGESSPLLIGPKFYREVGGDTPYRRGRNLMRFQTIGSDESLGAPKTKDNGLDGSNKILTTGVGGALTWGFSKLAKLVLEDPVKIMMKHQPTKEVLTRPLHFEEQFGFESQQLARDFIWASKSRNKL